MLIKYRPIRSRGTLRLLSTWLLKRTQIASHPLTTGMRRRRSLEIRFLRCRPLIWILLAVLPRFKLTTQICSRDWLINWRENMKCWAEGTGSICQMWGTLEAIAHMTCLKEVLVWLKGSHRQMILNSRTNYNLIRMQLIKKAELPSFLHYPPRIVTKKQVSLLQNKAFRRDKWNPP